MLNANRYTRQVDFQPVEIPIAGGDDGRYLYNLNSGDQTVSVIDADTDTVSTTITLTASKSFASVFYRSINKSVYCMGISYFDRIDADPSSGTFNTIVESGDTQLAAPGQNSYIPWPFDVITGTGVPRWLPMNQLNDATLPYNNQKFFSRDSRYGSIPIFGHFTPDNMTLHPRSRLFEVTDRGQSGAQFFDICVSRKRVTTFPPWVFRRAGMSADLAEDMCKTYVFGNVIIAATSTSIYLQLREYDLSPLYLVGTVSSGLNAGSVMFCEYAPNAKRLFITTKSVNTKIAVFDVDLGVFSSVGVIDRTAYKATNEDGADDMLYCPYNGKIYVAGKRHSTLTSGVNLVHVFDPTLDIGSMHTSSITVGEMASTLRHGNYTVNSLCMNRTRYWEAPDVII